MARSLAASGDIVIGASPIPAETRDTARPRCVSNHPVTVAIIGAKIAAAPAPTPAPKRSWKASTEWERAASVTEIGTINEPNITTGRGPYRSDNVPQVRLPTANARNPIVIAAETLASDQPVSWTIHRRRTGSEKSVPMATQPSRPPEATRIQ